MSRNSICWALIILASGCGGRHSIPPVTSTQQSMSSQANALTCPTILVIVPQTSLVQLGTQVMLHDELQVRKPFVFEGFHCKVVSVTYPRANWSTSGGSLKIVNGGTQAIFSTPALGSYTLRATYASYKAQASITVQLHNETVLASIFGHPNGPLLENSGAFYGVTYSGGGSGNGSVYKLVRNGTSYTVETIHVFRGGLDGSYPYGSLVAGKNGTLFGTTAGGGSTLFMGFGYGTVYELVPSGSQYVERILYRFQGQNDGSQPTTGLVIDSAGALYGTTGGSANGNIFKLTPRGSSYSFRVIYSFKGGSDGADPGGLIMASAGVFYGVTGVNGGASGTIFELRPAGSSYVERVLYNFQRSSDGYQPANVIVGSSGFLYGAASSGGAGNWGTAFELVPAQTGFMFHLLHSFSGSDGRYPEISFIRNGTLYGTTYAGGAVDAGTVFAITGSGQRVLHSFGGSSDGGLPNANLITDASGALYGVTESGGPDQSGDSGTVFKVTP